jgi:hypothetical protein
MVPGMIKKLARCITDNAIVHFQPSTGIWLDDGGHSHSNHELDFGPAEIAPTGNNPAADISEAGKVIQRISDSGFYYRLRNGGEEIGPFTVEDEENPGLDQTLASKLGVDIKEILAARLYEVKRPTNFDEMSGVLDSTIRFDRANKVILLCANLLTFTNEDQFNVQLAGESAGGKSYTALESISYFPEDAQMIVAGASPKAFMHEAGKWDADRKLLVVDLHQKILTFLDMPHYLLQQVLRPLLSHDRKELLYKITDKNRSGALRTKNVLIVGYPTAVFCAARFNMDEQEKTRMFILSPETSQQKLQESVRLRITRESDRKAFKEWVQSHPRRRWLKARIAAIREAGIQEIIIPNPDAVYDRFMEKHSRLAPRHQRDISRVIALAKASALLNWAFRESPTPGTIIATAEDLEAGFTLYGKVRDANELGLAPAIYDLWLNVINPLLVKTPTGIARRAVLTAYHQYTGRFMSDMKLRREILPSLESAGLTIEEPDPLDKRNKLLMRQTLESDQPPTLPVYPQIENIGTSSGGGGTLDVPRTPPPHPSPISQGQTIGEASVGAPPDEGNISPSFRAQNNIDPMWGVRLQNPTPPPHAAPISTKATGPLDPLTGQNGGSS